MATPTRPLIVVFARAPELGRVKTRLAAALGDARALELYRWLGARVVRGLSAHPAALRVSFTPDDREGAMRAWLGDAIEFAPQGDGDLGARMKRAVAQGFSRGHGAVLLVGADCAAVTAARLTEALTALCDHDAVMGPARDGGYYLLGLTRMAPVFDAMTWSTATVASETRQRFADAAMSVAELATETDIDEVSDLSSVTELVDAPPWVRDF